MTPALTLQLGLLGSPPDPVGRFTMREGPSVVILVRFPPRMQTVMTYTVLARKFRPRQFSELVGQDHVVRALSNALDSGRLHHAWLFTGTRGVGKTTVSRILAKSLNCLGGDGHGGVTSKPCGVCDACRDIDQGRFVDYIELDAASNRGVDEVQALLEQAVYKPVQGRFKVFMIDEVHMLTNTAFNAMLKTLEEPPEYLKFVLATTDPQKIPVTVLSRCLQFNLRPMPATVIASHLQSVLQAEEIPFESGALHALGRAAKGSMRDALSLTDQAIAFSAGKVALEGVRSMLGASDSTWIHQVLQALSLSDVKSLCSVIDSMRKEGVSPSWILSDLARVLHQMAIYQWTQTWPEGSEQDTEVLAQLSQNFATDEIQLLYSLVLQGQQEISLAPDESAGLEMVLMRFLPFKTQVTQRSTPTTSVSTRPIKSSSDAKAELETVSSAVAAVAEGDVQSFDWYGVVERLAVEGKITAMSRELAIQSMFVNQEAIPSGGWRLSLQVASETLAQPQIQERLSRALAQEGWAVELRVKVGEVTDCAARRMEASALAKLREAESSIWADPALSALKESFGGVIVPGTLKGS